MAQSPSLQSLDCWVPPHGWGWAGHADSASPASSSSDSSGSCPCDGARGPARPALPAARGAAPTAPARARPGPAGGQRRSASEREKLRMRTLARALHELRRFLPPSGAPGGQSLTKIETLRLAIRYIGHLSAVLGLSEESLRRRRRGDALPPPRGGCALGPDGGPALPCGPGLGAAASAGAWAPSPACAGVPAAPERWGSSVPDVGLRATPQSLPHVAPGSAPDAALWARLQTRPGTRTSPPPGSQAAPCTPRPAAPALAAVHQGIPVSPESYPLPETPPLLPRSACQRLQPQTQWGYWSHSAEMLPGSEDQGPGPTLQLSDENLLQSSGLQLSGCPELWQEDLQGGHLGIFY